MKRYHFEIVRRAFGRFGWIFLVDDDRGRRVLARSVRSYRSKERVRQAIAALEGAPIDDATNDHVPYPLPTTSFRLVPGVVPLIVEEGPVDYDPAELQFQVAGWDTRTGDQVEEEEDEKEEEEEVAAAAVRQQVAEAKEEAEAKAPAKRAPAKSREPAARRSSRRKQTT